MAEQGTQTVNIFIHEVTVHDTRDPWPGHGEYDVSFVGAATPSRAAPEARSGVRWTHSVQRGHGYPVGSWTGPVTFPSTHSLVVAGAGEELDRFRNDVRQGGLSILSADHDWGVGRWWQTKNGPHFDFLFFVARVPPAADGAAPQNPTDPEWASAATQDAPGPSKPTFDEYAGAFGAPLQQG
jgi:hypothetical protein